MIRRFLLLSFFACFGTEFSLAMEQEPPIGFEISVDRVEVDVLVTDEDGNFVHGLTQDDFEVYEEGKRVKIEDFELRSLLSEPSENALMPEGDSFVPEPRKFVLFIDMLNCTSSRIQSIKPELLHFIKNVLHPKDQVLIAILTADRRALIMQTFTSSRERLLKAIEVLHGSPARGVKKSQQENDLHLLLSQENRGSGRNRGDLNLAKMQTLIQMATDFVRNIASDEYHRAEYSLNALASVVERIDDAGWQTGRKTVIYVSEGISLRPGQRLMDIVNRYIEQFNAMLIENAAASGRQQTYRMYPVTTDQDLTPFLRKTTGRLNRIGATLYTIDARGIFRSAFDDPSRPIPVLSMAEQQMSFVDEQQSLNALASDTGGLAYLNTNNYSKVLNQIEKDNQLRYFLTYQAPKHKNKSKKAKLYEIKVKCKKPRVMVRSRNSYLDI